MRDSEELQRWHFLTWKEYTKRLVDGEQRQRMLARSMIQTLHHTICRIQSYHLSCAWSHWKGLCAAATRNQVGCCGISVLLDPPCTYHLMVYSYRELLICCLCTTADCVRGSVRSVDCCTEELVSHLHSAEAETSGNGMEFLAKTYTVRCLVRNLHSGRGVLRSSSSSKDCRSQQQSPPCQGMVDLVQVIDCWEPSPVGRAISGCYVKRKSSDICLFD